MKYEAISVRDIIIKLLADYVYAIFMIQKSEYVLLHIIFQGYIMVI